MRELIYLSQNKLAQFTDAEHGQWKLGVDAKVQVPLLGELSASASHETAPDAQHFEKIASLLARDAVPYTDQVAPGTWVSFLLPMTYAIVGDSFGRDFALVFLGVPEDPESSAPRLLLHGDPNNLVGARPRQSRELTDKMPFLSPSSISDFLRCVRLFLNGEDPDDDKVEPLIASLITTLDKNTVPQTAAKMSGLARVTANFTDDAGRPVVFATPLHVQYAPGQQPVPFPPDQQPAGRWSVRRLLWWRGRR